MSVIELLAFINQLNYCFNSFSYALDFKIKPLPCYFVSKLLLDFKIKYLNINRWHHVEQQEFLPESSSSDFPHFIVAHSLSPLCCQSLQRSQGKRCSMTSHCSMTLHCSVTSHCSMTLCHSKQLF
jgi:hypothetical protein